MYAIFAEGEDNDGVRMAILHPPLVGNKNIVFEKRICKTSKKSNEVKR